MFRFDLTQLRSFMNLSLGLSKVGLLQTSQGLRRLFVAKAIRYASPVMRKSPAPICGNDMPDNRKLDTESL